METKLHTFIDIFDTEFEINGEQVKLKKIVIPIIQRDYAQGRKSPEIDRVRNRFLHALKDAVCKTPVTLDFVYGNVDADGVLTPLDGQQRLTTLFLLHWYAMKKENLPAEEYAFLNNFSYETRYSARDFCKELVQFTPTFSYPTIAEEIIDQNWFPLDWKKDPTISSMLVMIDDINNYFHDITDLWEKLKGKSISFYFLPIKDMGLTDELYIKMNSRGKPLTNFEHFKAEFEHHLREIDKNIAERIIHKIDIDWTDMLWQYRGDDNITDDEFLRYFNFVCDIICYQNNHTPQGKSQDQFDLLDEYFSKNSDNLSENIALLESYFDCWCELSKTEKPSDFCARLMSKEHEERKVKIDNRYDIDIFNDCLRNYGEMQSNGNRKFPLGRIVILYALISYLQHPSDDLSRRLRIINNLVMNSEYEISDSESRQGGNRMPAILRQVDSIIQDGKIIEGKEPNFNVNQIQEEQAKMAWVNEHPELSESLFELEDHPLLDGQISIVDLDHPEYFSRFHSLFNCDWELIGKAMLSIGDYKQKERNGRRYQLGSSMDLSWKFLFHQSGAAGFENTKTVLSQLLFEHTEFSDSTLQEMVDSYLTKCDTEHQYDWRYYYIKYPSFCPGRYGKYEWTDYENNPYVFNALYTRYNPSENSYCPFLHEINAEHINRDDYGHSLLFNHRKVYARNDAFVVCDADTEEEFYRLDIPMSDDGIDETDRIQLVKNDEQIKNLC
jgi:hypothetical protein